MDKKTCLKWAMFGSFVILVVGGLNYLLMGLLQFDLFGEVFGFDSIVGRIIYTLFGLSALVLGVIVVYKAFYAKNQSTSQSSPRSSTSASNGTSSRKSR